MVGMHSVACHTGCCLLLRLLALLWLFLAACWRWWLPADGRQPQGAALDSARQNLAATFVNAFVNAGFGNDKLVTTPSEAAGGSDTGGCCEGVSAIKGLAGWRSV